MRKASPTLPFGLALFVAFTFLNSATAAAQQNILGEEHWVTSVSAADGKPLKIYVWEKRLRDVDVKQFGATGKIVLLAHGATTPGRVAFDLQVP